MTTIIGRPSQGSRPRLPASASTSAIGPAMLAITWFDTNVTARKMLSPIGATYVGSAMSCQ